MKISYLLGPIVCISVLLLTVRSLYNYYPINRDRIVGVYRIDTQFYPGSNADWQYDHFSFEIQENDNFIFREKLKDGSIKIKKGRVEWYRRSSPMLFRINIDHDLVDKYPALYRGNRKFYFVFETKFGNMFYRKIDKG